MVISTYQRKEVSLLTTRLLEQPRFLIFVAGPRQVGKTTLVRQALTEFNPDHYHFVSVDQPDEIGIPDYSQAVSTTYDQFSDKRDTEWLVEKWQKARLAARQSDSGHILVLDEIQKIANWSEAVKGLWDTDRAENLNLHVVLLGSSPLLMQKGMSESLTGRYELFRISHWSFPEMSDAFGFDLDDYIYFGGYPGSASLIRDEARWRNYVTASLIEPSIEKDIFEMTRVDKPALLKQLFYIGSAYSSQIVALSNVKGHLQNAGNETTLAGYLDLLSSAGLLVGLQKYYKSKIIRQRASPPKFNVLNNALMSATSDYTKSEAKADRSYWGRVVESAIGQHLYNSCRSNLRLYYWREASTEVDFVIASGNEVCAVEVKSGVVPSYVKGLEIFEKKFGECRKHVIGNGGVSLVEFLSYPAEHWL